MGECFEIGDAEYPEQILSRHLRKEAKKVERPQFLELVEDELDSATEKYGPIASPHEAYAIIQEELDEFWQLVKENRARGVDGLNELVQIAAMAYSTAIDEGFAR